MSGQHWFEVVTGRSLLQGDVILNCPVPQISSIDLPIEIDQDVAIDIATMDLIVMSQSCDIENEKVEDVVLARVIGWKAAKEDMMASGNTFAKSKNFRKQLIAGNVPGLSLLKEFSEEPRLVWSIVDFHQLHVLAKAFVESFAESAGPRLRLIPPYREHLSQAFARYFMRVGLPHDANEFESIE